LQVLHEILKKDLSARGV